LYSLCNASGVTGGEPDFLQCKSLSSPPAPTGALLCRQNDARSDELLQNLREVIEMLLEDGQPTLESEFVDVRTAQVA